jgi:phage terminase small subunit
MKQKLTPKQKLFCDKYIECKNATESALFAGYSEKTASEMGYENLNKPQLKSYIDERLEKVSEKLKITFEDCLEALWENHQLARAPDGESGRIDVRASSDAIKEVNKMLGHNAPERREINSNVNIGGDFGDGGDDL